MESPGQEFRAGTGRFSKDVDKGYGCLHPLQYSKQADSKQETSVLMIRGSAGEAFPFTASEALSAISVSSAGAEHVFLNL